MLHFVLLFIQKHTSFLEIYQNDTPIYVYLMRKYVCVRGITKIKNIIILVFDFNIYFHILSAFRIEILQILQKKQHQI